MIINPGMHAMQISRHGDWLHSMGVMIGKDEKADQCSYWYCNESLKI